MAGEHPIPISVVELGPDVEDLVLQVIRSGVIAQGPMVATLEREFAAMIGVEHVVAVNNGTTALIAAMSALGLGPGDEVVTSPFTFVATLNAILSTGASVRFGDISATDFNITIDSIEAACTERTRAVVPVHLYGQCADMPAIAGFAAQRGIGIVEDAAQAHGATIGDRSAGSWGIGCFSLYATKNLTSGEGGLISTNDAQIADHLRVLRNQGMRQRYQYEMVGNNYRLTDLQAAVCLPGLRNYESLVERRRANAARLTEGLADVAGLTVPAVIDGRGHVWHQYTVLVDDEAGCSRDSMVEQLGAAGIGCGVYYPRLVFDYDCYRAHPGLVASDVPVAARVVQQCLSLPVHPHLSDGDLDRIIAEVRRIGRA
jgi:perosamine synthetase